MLQQMQEQYGIIVKTYYCSISQHFGNPTFPDLLTLPDIKHVGFLFIGGEIWWVQNNWYLQAFFKIFGLWNIDKCWKSENRKKIL